MSVSNLESIEAKAASYQGNQDPIYRSLSIPCGGRTPKDIVPIAEFIRGLHFFQAFSAYPDTVAEVAARLEMESFINGETIFLEGDPGDKFFIILDGEISIMKQKRLHSLLETATESTLLIKLTVGGYFGENALENHNGLRTASAFATRASNLLVLKRDDYQQILSLYNVLLKRAVIHTFSTPSSIFSHMPADKIEAIADLVTVRTYFSGQQIVSTGDRLNSLMVIKSGLVKIVKSMPMEQMRGALKEVDAKFKLPKIASKKKEIHESSSQVSSDSKSSVTFIDKPLSEKTSSSYTIKSSPKNGRTLKEKPAEESTTPPGYWILKRSDEYLQTSKIVKPVKPAIFLPNQPRSISGKIIVRDISTPEPESIEFTVSVLMPGQVVGELAILDSEQCSPLTAIASTLTEVYCFDSEVLIAQGILEDKYVMRRLMDDWKFRNPPLDEMRKQLKAKYEWERQKNKVLEELKI